MALEEEELLLKQLPHSVEAEQAVLGSMLIDPRCVPEVIDKLRPDDFYLQQNRDIYETIYSMFNYSMTIDPVTVLENMKQNGVYDENQSRGYLLQLMDTTPTAANVVEYIGILKDKTLLRRVAEAAGDLTALIQQGTETGQDILEAAEQRIYAIRQGRAARGLIPISNEKKATFFPDFFPASSRIFRAMEVLPIPGRAASRIRSDLFRPEMARSRSVRPVDRPGMALSLAASSARRSYTSMMTSEMGVRPRAERPWRMA